MNKITLWKIMLRIMHHLNSKGIFLYSWSFAAVYCCLYEGLQLKHWKWPQKNNITHVLGPYNSHNADWGVSTPQIPGEPNLSLCYINSFLFQNINQVPFSQGWEQSNFITFSNYQHVSCKQRCKISKINLLQILY